MRTCGLLDHNKNKVHTSGIYLPRADQQVKITFESNAQVIESEEPTKTIIRISNDTLDYKLKPKKLKNEKPTVKKFEDVDEDELAKLAESARSYVHKRMEQHEHKHENVSRKLRHARKHIEHEFSHKNHKNARNHSYSTHPRHNNRSIDKSIQEKSDNTDRWKKIHVLKEQLSFPGQDRGSEETDEKGPALNETRGRYRRNQAPMKPPALLDHGIQHGGNALRNSSESSVSSFEEGLLNCYEGQVLLAQEFEPSELCTNVSHLVNGKHMQTRHDVAEDGYYYYIFYSDNDIVFNDMHAVFDIYKPTFQYENVTKSCLKKTECTFPLTMLSNDRVIVEVPTKDGIEHEQDDISLLISVCHPRMGMYTIFPIAVLFLIISCAFM